jgi:hypothetical protein
MNEYQIQFKCCGESEQKNRLFSSKIAKGGIDYIKDVLKCILIKKSMI